jgi:hypothetical protein
MRKGTQRGKGEDDYTFNSNDYHEEGKNIGVEGV